MCRSFILTKMKIARLLLVCALTALYSVSASPCAEWIQYNGGSKHQALKTAIQLNYFEMIECLARDYGMMFSAYALKDEAGPAIASWLEDQYQIPHYRESKQKVVIRSESTITRSDEHNNVWRSFKKGKSFYRYFDAVLASKKRKLNGLLVFLFYAAAGRREIAKHLLEMGLMIQVSTRKNEDQLLTLMCVLFQRKDIRFSNLLFSAIEDADQLLQFQLYDKPEDRHGRLIARTLWLIYVYQAPLAIQRAQASYLPDLIRSLPMELRKFTLDHSS